MKVSGKGVIVIILFVAIIPLLTVAFAEVVFKGKVGGLSGYLVASYIYWFLVYFLVFLPIALLIIHLFRKHRY
jgi:hypothetical protein